MRRISSQIIFILCVGIFFGGIYGTISFAPYTIKALGLKIAKTVYADSSLYDQALNIATGQWQQTLMKKAMIEAGLPEDTKKKQAKPFDGNFGGQILFSFPCICNASTVFLIRPIHGIVGPYVVYWTLPYLRDFRLVVPGNYVLGKSSKFETGLCSIYVLIWCFNFKTYDITALTGMGTSLIP